MLFDVEKHVGVLVSCFHFGGLHEYEVTLHAVATADSEEWISIRITPVPESQIAEIDVFLNRFATSSQKTSTSPYVFFLFSSLKEGE